ncbi:hypothetical protein SASPL_133679 [Salvia splendens]|uniref:Uncharacterized protein n=1 Tax=Salvia splendens TaxID=180675 RepID=A0A8X8ZI95_SALSN|nr:hypothetical protein SASPL_133679 [Salvia splendens]
MCLQFVAMQLASFWLGSSMNTNRIKRAIYRAKERKCLRSFRKCFVVWLTIIFVSFVGLGSRENQEEKFGEQSSSQSCYLNRPQSRQPEAGKIKEVDLQHQPRPYGYKAVKFASEKRKKNECPMSRWLKPFFALRSWLFRKAEKGHKLR